MLRIRRYLNPYMLMFAASVVLLFAQANFDLALPDYLSQIVNTGIQQGGIESPVPEAMRVETLERIALFLSPEEETAVRNAYTLVRPDFPGSDDYLESYPLLDTEPIYVLKELSEEEIEQLSTPIAQALLVVSALEQAMADPEAAAQMGGQGDFDLSRLPAGMDLFTVLGRLPAAQR
ncbi:MAG: hypothetical protein KC425_18475, partial [Anaerolineales bacterium]|nr:hypothetical protein [Anaerolineales bacterium]